ncbi:alpha-galactosidase [Halobacteriales archaeon QS_9_68_17]|nr:MAG: alpha-galactosidase [Halobacteriales archaeon QS_9_68_17]
MRPDGSLTLRAGETTVAFDAEACTLRVERGGECALAGRLQLAAPDAEGPTLTPGSGVREVVRELGWLRVAFDDAWSTTVELRAVEGAVDVDVAVQNPRDHAVAVGDPALLADAAAAYGGNASVYWHGYQSWTPTATLPVGERFAPEPAGKRPQMRDLAAPRDASHGLVGLVPDAGPGSALTLAVLDHERFVTRFDVDHDSDGVDRVTAVCPGDGATLSPGERLELPTLRVDGTRPLGDALAAVGDAVGDRMDATVPEDAPTGWCSWYHYFADVTEGAVRENLDSLDDWGVPVDVIQLDDGYQAAFGDWTTLADGFDDPAGLFEDVGDAGHVPGLWLAPFYEDGEPVSAAPRHGPMYGLDATHPEVEAWLRETFATVVDDWGVEYLKLDFLYAAALPGNRFDDAATRAEAYRNGLATIRDAVGDDVTILGCGAPGFQSVGLVDAMRVGPDTAPHWRASPESQPAHENAVRNVLNRQWAHRRLWLNDPDCQLVRETTDLTLAERRSFAAIVALLGGTNVVSDRVADIEPSGRRLVERSLPPIERGDVHAVGERELPTRVVAEREADGGLAVAAFNWEDHARTVRVDPADHGLDDGLVWDAWNAELVDGPFEREVPAHGCQLCHLAPAGARPRLVGSDHLGNLATRIARSDWRDGRLHVTLSCEGPRAVAVAVPGDWTYDPVASSTASGADRSHRRPTPATSSADVAGESPVAATGPGERAETTTDGAVSVRTVVLSPGENRLTFDRP